MRFLLNIWCGVRVSLCPQGANAHLQLLPQGHDTAKAQIEKKLGNKGFVDRAPAEVVQEHQQRLVDWQQKLEHTRKSLDALGGTVA